MPKKRFFDTDVLTVFMCIFAVSLVIWGFSGNLPPAANPYNSYSLQAKSWLSGRLDLGQNYSHLEIAEYAGKYYISFPPFPSILLMPFVLLFGTNTPDTLISVIAAAIAGIYALKIAQIYIKDRYTPIFWSLFVTLGTNFVFVMTQGWVWFIAQTLAFALSMAAIYYAIINKRALSFFLWACAVGCRPFSALYLPVFIYIMRKNETGFRDILKSFVPAVFMAAVYMLLNFMRFGNPLEFGHNYLPEFVNSEHGQFSFTYIPENIKNLLRFPSFSEGFAVFPNFNGFAFFIAIPIFISYIVYFIKSKKSRADITLLLLLIINLLLLAAHKTMGGWQFGNRYTIDLLPFMYIGLLQFIKNKPFPPANLPLLLFGLVLNVAGTISLMTGAL